MTLSVGCGAEAVAVAADGDNVAVVEESVEDGHSDDGVAEDGAPSKARRPLTRPQKGAR